MHTRMKMLFLTPAAAAAVALAGCSSSSAPSAVNAVPLNGAKSVRFVQPRLPLQAMEALHPAHSGPQRSGNRGHGWLSAQAKGGTGLLYVGDFDNNVVNIYNRRGVNPSQIGQITEGLGSPERLFVDAAGSLYVSNGTGNTVTVYPKGATTPSLTISDQVSGPTGLTVDSAGTVYVANTGTGTITEYAAGSASPSLTIDSPGAEDLATDSNDNLYAAGGSGVTEYAPGATSGTNLGITVGDATGIEVDRSGNLALEDLGGDAIDLYHAGQNQPYRQIALSGLPFELAMNKKQGQLYASVLVGSGFVVQRVGYPNGNPTAKLDNTGSATWPLAVSPDDVQ